MELDRHVEAEDKILEQYRNLAETIDNGPIAILIDLILTEEEQHHFLLHSMAKRITEPFTKRGQEELEDVNRDEFLHSTRRLREHEQETINACRRLKSQLPLEERDLFDALLDAIILDSQKHERLLLAVEKMIPT